MKYPDDASITIENKDDINMGRRKALAKQMRAEGKSLEEIVEAAGAPRNSYQQNLKTVQRWLGEDK